LSHLLEDEIKLEKNARRFDLFSGNRLATVSTNVLAFPSASNFSNLGCSFINV
jgi:hypothetical protein